MAQIIPFVFSLSGGLVLNKSSFEISPGAATELKNYEPSVEGGYRRIDGTTRWNSNIVPQTAAANEKVLLSAWLGTTMIAARGEKIFKATSDTASWTEIDTGRTSAERYTFERYNYDGTDKIIMADGANHASTYDGTTLTDMNGALGGGAGTAPTDPAYVVSFREHMFYAGTSTNPHEVVFSAPFDENDFTAGNGAGSLKCDSEVTGMKVWRKELYIFCEESIHKIVGSSLSDFAMEPVTSKIGCLNNWTVQEFGGDLIFLAPDGLRTIAGTAKIDDTELGTISHAVRPRFNGITDASLFDSLVIPSKTQYRLFMVEAGEVESTSDGIICVQKGTDVYEFADIEGIKPSSTDFHIVSGQERIIHGGYDGYIYEQEDGNDFNGTPIIGNYRSPDIAMGDAGLTKDFFHILANYSPESVINADIYIRYDYEVDTAPRPDPYPLSVSTLVSVYGTAVYGTGIYGGASNPVLRQPIEGSGVAIAIRVQDDGTTSAPYTLRGFQLEYSEGARR